MGLPESHDQKKNLDIIFHEIIKENCPHILEAGGKINIEESTDHFLKEIQKEKLLGTLWPNSRVP